MTDVTVKVLVEDDQFREFQERVRQVREDLERIAQLSGTQQSLYTHTAVGEREKEEEET